MNKWLVIFVILFGCFSCRKDNAKEIKPEVTVLNIIAEWYLVYYSAQTWGVNGDSTYFAYPQDTDTDWVVTVDSLKATNPLSFNYPYELINDTIFVAHSSAYKRPYKIIELTDSTLKVDALDPYYPGTEYHFKKL